MDLRNGGAPKVGAGRGLLRNLETYDPMAEAYRNVEFNSYPSGPGSNVKQSMQVESRRREEGSNFKLYVGHIPPNINEVGLRNIFSVFGQPVRIFLSHKPGAESKNKWAFVEYKTMNEARSAIYELNKAPPHHLHVSFAMCEEEKAERRKQYLEAANSQAQESPRPLMPSGAGFGRGMIPPMRGVPPKSVKSPLSPAGAGDAQCRADSIETGFSSERFQHYRRDKVIDAGTEVFASMTASSHGSRRVSLGRGCFCPDNINDIRAFRHPFYRQLFEGKVKQLKDSTVHYSAKKDGKYYYNEDINQKEAGKCAKCGVSTWTACSMCKTVYCSTACMTDDYDKHRNKCPATQARGEKEKIYENGNVRPQSNNDTTRKETMAPNKTNPTQRSSLNKNRDKYPGDRHYNNNKSNKHAYVRNQPPNNYITRPDSQHSGDNHNKGRKSLEFVPKSHEQAEKIPTMAPPIPLDKFTKVEVTSPVKEGSEMYYWVMEVSRMKEQVEIVKKLEDHCAKNQTKKYTPTVGALCAAPYIDEWFRAKVLELGPEVKVHFVDFGNEEVCPPTLLKELPQDLINIPPMAFKIRLADGTSSKYHNLSENSRFDVKPVSKDSTNNVWIVHVEGETYPVVEPAQQHSSPLPIDGFEKVKIMFISSDDEYWVQKNSSLKEFLEMTLHLGDCSAVRIKPVLGETYTNQYNGDTWCRAKVVSTDPLKVFYIDYGNSQEVNETDLHPVPAAYKEVPPMAFHIKLSEGTSSKYFGLNMFDSLSVKAFSKLEDNTYIVHVEGETYKGMSPSVMETIQRRPNQNEKSLGCTNHVLFLVEEGEEIELKVERVVSDEHLLGTLIIQRGAPPEKPLSRLDYLSNDQISARLSSIKPPKRFSPKLGDAVWTKHNGELMRGYMMGEWKSDWRVALVDSGLVVRKQTLHLFPLPKELQLIPEAAVRCLLDTPLLQGIKLEGEVLKGRASSYRNGVLKVELDDFGVADIVGWEPMIEEAGLQSIEISSGSRVILSSYHSPQALYIQSLNTENLNTLAVILQDVAAHCVKASPLERSPLTGEYLACKFNIDGNYYRAQITKKVEDKYRVTFVDYGNSEVVSVSEMRTLPAALKSIPCCAVKVGLKGVPTTGFLPTAMTLLNQISAEATELHLTYENDDLSAVSLVCKTGMMLNETLAEMAQPKWKKALAQGKDPSEGHVFMVSDLKYVDWPVKSKMSIMILVDHGHNIKLAVGTTFDYLTHVSKTLSDQINEYAEATSSDETYNPRPQELCIAKYTEDGRWYRAVCNKILVTTSEILFVDYGNVGEVSHSNIRRMPPDFISSPTILKSCKIYGIPDQVSDKCATELNKILDEGTTQQVIVIESNLNEALVWIPSLDSKLLKMGLPPVKSPFSS